MENNLSNINVKLTSVMNDIEQAAREIYYAMTFIPYNSSARVHLKLTLKYLGVERPADVGLSSRAGDYRDYENPTHSSQ